MRWIAVCSGALWCLLVCFGGGAAQAQEGDQAAKAMNDKAMAEFGLGDYGPAAEHYESAFRLKPDGALLYNAAQSHRLAGNKKRALDLYRNFVRLYGAKSPLAGEARRRIAELERAMTDDDKSPSTSTSTSTPTSTPTHGGKAPAVAPAAVPAPRPATVTPTATVTTTASPAPAAVAGAEPAVAPPPPLNLSAPTPPPPPPPDTSLVSRKPAAPWSSILSSPWLWAGVGAAVATAVVLLIVLNPSYPDATFGQARGN